MYIVIWPILVCIFLTKFIINIFKNLNEKAIFNINNLFPKKFIHKKENNDQLKETYFATLIHDLKTPAFAQIRSLKMLLDGHFGILNNAQYDIIKETLYSEKYMADIVSDILTAYKCDYSDLKLKCSYFDAANVLNTVYESLKGLAEDRKQNINISYDCSNLYIYADKLQITRVISNLISNAIKYGYIGTEIKINLHIDNKKLEFSVENEGSPIPKEKLSKIFEKFSGNGVTYYNNASTGLGLYLSKRIIEMHKGQIFAQCTKKGISTFGFKLKTKTENTVKCYD